MSRETLTLEFGTASAPLRKATIEEVIIRRFGGVGPDQPHILRITVEYDDPRPRPKRVDPVNELPTNRFTELANELREEFSDQFRRDHDDWAV